MLEYQILYVLEGNKKKAHELGEKIIAEGQQQRSSLNSWLWQLMTMRATAGKYRPLCLQAARKLAQQNPSSYELDTIALALFENGLLEEALDFQKRAVGKGGASKGMMRRLKLFEEAMARKKAPTSRRTDGR